MNENDNNSNRFFNFSAVLIALGVVPLLSGIVLVGRWMAVTVGVLLVGSMAGLIHLSWSLAGTVVGLEFLLGMLQGIGTGGLTLVRMFRDPEALAEARRKAHQDH